MMSIELMWHSAFDKTRGIPLSRLQALQARRRADCDIVVSFISQGHPPKAPSWGRCWVRAFTVRRLVIVLLQNALNNGTVDWDATISQVLYYCLDRDLFLRSGRYYNCRSGRAASAVSVVPRYNNRVSRRH